jgi:hypothetical protein
MTAGTVKWFTRKSRPSPGASDSRRALIRALGGPTQRAVLRDRVEATFPDAETGRTELRCAGCGYGVVVSGSVPLCPMCRSSDWEPLPERKNGAESAAQDVLSGSYRSARYHLPARVL